MGEKKRGGAGTGRRTNFARSVRGAELWLRGSGRVGVGSSADARLYVCVPVVVLGCFCAGKRSVPQAAAPPSGGTTPALAESEAGSVRVFFEGRKGKRCSPPAAPRAGLGRSGPGGSAGPERSCGPGPRAAVLRDPRAGCAASADPAASLPARSTAPTRALPTPSFCTLFPFGLLAVLLLLLFWSFFFSLL